MSIAELTEKVRNKPLPSHEERVKALREAKIIGEKGYYNRRYFTKETVQLDKQGGKPAVA